VRRGRPEQQQALAYQQAIDEAFHPRREEIDQVRSPRYGVYVERAHGRVNIHLLREWGAHDRRVDSVKVESFDGTEVEAAAIFLEELRHEGLAREERDLNEWIRQRRLGLAKHSARPEGVTRALSPTHRRALADLRAARRQREEEQKLAEERVAAIEADGLAKALRSQPPNDYR
jgi:hypothetical protein